MGGGFTVKQGVFRKESGRGWRGKRGLSPIIVRLLSARIPFASNLMKLSIPKNFFKAAVLSIAAAIATIAIPYIFVLILGASFTIYDEDRRSPSSSQGAVRTMEELEKASRDMDMRIERLKKSPPGIKEVSRAARTSFWWLTWFPWLVLPFLVKSLVRPPYTLLLIVPMFIAASIQWLMWREVILSVVVFGLVIVIIHLTKKIKIKSN